MGGEGLASHMRSGPLFMKIAKKVTICLVVSKEMRTFAAENEKRTEK